MDAETVRNIEFSRSLRGYNITEVDLFLEKMESAFARRDLEAETLQKKIRDLTENKENQAEKIRELGASLNASEKEKTELVQQLEESQKAEKTLQETVRQLQDSLEEVKARLEAAEKSVANAKKEKEKPSAPSVPAEKKSQTASNGKASREVLQKKLKDAGSSARDSLKQLANNLKERSKK